MGLSSSQARLLHLTARMHQIEHKAAKLEAEKLRMANESDRVYNEYLDALDASKIQYKSLASDGSVTFRDANLNILQNGIINGYSGEHTSESLFLQNTSNGNTIITRAVANAFDLNGVSELRTLPQYLTDLGFQLSSTLVATNQPDFNNVVSFNPIGNSNTAPVQSVYISDISSYLTNTNNTIGIATADDFQALLTHTELWNRNLVLETDVDLTGINWTGIGNNTTQFTGSFNGNGHTISNLTMTANSMGYGLFGFTSNGATISNIIMSNANIISSTTTDSHVGTLVGQATNTTIQNCCILNSSVQGYSDVALLVGHLTGNSTVQNCYVQGTVTSTYADAGGITGEMDQSTQIINSYSAANVTIPGSVPGFAGGIVGKNIQMTANSTQAANALQNCGASGTVSATNCCGQIIGAAREGTDTSNNSFASVTSSWSSTYWDLSGSTPSLVEQPSEDFITVSSITSGNNQAYVVPPLVSIISNIECAFNKAGITGISNSQITNWINTNYGENNDLNNKRLAALNNNLVDFLMENTYDTTFITALSLDITGADTSNTSSYTNIYDSATGISFQRGFNEQTCQVSTSSSSGTVIIPSLTTIASNIRAALVNAGHTVSESDVSNWLYNFYGTDNNTNNVRLANINQLIVEYANDPRPVSQKNSMLDNLYNHVLGNTLYNLNSYYNISGYESYRNNYNTPCECEYGPVMVTQYFWDTSNQNIVNAITMWTLAQHGIEIIDEPLASNVEYLQNLLESGDVVLTSFNNTNPNDILGMTNSDVANLTIAELDALVGADNRSVSTEVNLQEVQDTTKLKKAEAKYEADMLKIDRKERKYDAELASFDNERNAIKNEMETLKSVAKDNVDRTFKLFS